MEVSTRCAQKLLALQHMSGQRAWAAIGGQVVCDQIQLALS